ncbi:MAG: exonuclease SbcCD subunit D [Oscillospiraceae bacterium]|nr:exonuclease SbcCD subunit D [Oscillospiraceae bacterium]
MKLIHLSDLHLGKRVNEFSMLEDQSHILWQILSVVDDEKPDAVIIAGDVYDKSVPNTEAVTLFDRFLSSLCARALPVFIISGNHDSPERLSFGGGLFKNSGIFFSPVYNGEAQPVYLEDEHGKLAVWMLPFIKPANVRRFYPDEPCQTYTEAVKTALSHFEIDNSIRNVLVTHQFVTGASRSDSEEISVGGSDNVDASVFDAFDYVALGHIHGPQNVGAKHIRYCGTPLKYSFSEAKHEKSVTVAELLEKGALNIRTIPLSPLRDMREIKGKYDELMLRENYENANREDYLRVILTDEEDIPDAVRRMRVVYPNIMKLEYDNRRTRASFSAEGAENTEKKSPIELFSELFSIQNQHEMSDEQENFMLTLIERIKEGEI